MDKVTSLLFIAIDYYSNSYTQVIVSIENQIIKESLNCALLLSWGLY